MIIFTPFSFSQFTSSASLVISLSFVISSYVGDLPNSYSIAFLRATDFLYSIQTLFRTFRVDTLCSLVLISIVITSACIIIQFLGMSMPVRLLSPRYERSLPGRKKRPIRSGLKKK